MRWRDAFAFCALSACTDAKRVSDTPPAAAPVRTVAVVDSSSSNSAGPVVPLCSDTLETVALRCARGAVERRGDTLVLRDARGRSIVRISNPVDGEEYLIYRYFGRLTRPDGGHLHIVDVQGYENGSVELIADDIGFSIRVGGYPILSPDGFRFATAAASYETCEGRTELDVWRLAAGAPIREFTIAPFDCTRDVGWWPTDVTWRSPDTLRFIRHVLATDSTRHKSGAHDSTTALLVRRGTAWALDSASAAGVPRFPSDSLDH